jgi:hypothetical protein
LINKKQLRGRAVGALFWLCGFEVEVHGVAGASAELVERDELRCGAVFRRELEASAFGAISIGI